MARRGTSTKHVGPVDDGHNKNHVMTINLTTLKWSCECGAKGRNDMPTHMEAPGPRYWGYTIKQKV